MQIIIEPIMQHCVIFYTSVCKMVLFFFYTERVPQGLSRIYESHKTVSMIEVMAHYALTVLLWSRGLQTH